MKKILISLTIASLVLSGCNRDTVQSDSEEPFFYTHSTAEFSIDVPEDWEVVNTFTVDYPREIQVGFRNNIKDGDFVANVNIAKEANPRLYGNVDFGQSKLKDHSATLINYQLTEQEEVELMIGNASSVSSMKWFTGKTDTDQKTLHFIQTYLTEAEDAWIVTATHRPDEDPFVIERMETMLKSFTLN